MNLYRDHLLVQIFLKYFDKFYEIIQNWSMAHSNDFFSKLYILIGNYKVGFVENQQLLVLV